MLIRRPPSIPPSEITPRSVWHERRTLLKAALAGGAWMAGATGAIAAPGRYGREAIPDVAPSPLSTQDTPTDHELVTSYNNFVELGSGKSAPKANAAALPTRPWTLRVEGECEDPGEMGIEEILAAFPQEERIYRLRCVEAWAMVIPWVGFPLGDLLKLFRPTSKARYVEFTALHDPKRLPGQRDDLLPWPYLEGLRIDEAMHPLTILATGLYGEVLPEQNGAPLRLVVPWKYGFKSIKSVVRVRFVEQEPITTWSLLQPDEYGFYANVNPEVDHPRWSQKTHRMIGDGLFASRRTTAPFNGYADQVASLYRGMDLKRHF